MKRTLYFGSPAHLSTENEQLVINREGEKDVTIPIEDIAYLILEHYKISITKTIIQKLAINNTAVIVTDEKHMPTRWLMPLQGNSTQSKVFQAQSKASESLKNRLWKQIIKAKINNQARLLRSHDIGNNTLILHAKKVKNGDPDNREAQAAKYYWKYLFSPFNFKRERFGGPPNNLLNYGYSILRAMVGRSLVSSGLLPSIGIHHRNQYNSFPLADDIMEPFRPFVDEIVLNLALSDEKNLELTKETKRKLLDIPTMDVQIKNEHRSMMNALSLSTASLARCFLLEQREIIFPTPCP